MRRPFSWCSDSRGGCFRPFVVFAYLVAVGLTMDSPGAESSTLYQDHGGNTTESDTGNPFPADEELFNDEDLIKLYDDEELLDVEGVSMLIPSGFEVSPITSREPAPEEQIEREASTAENSDDGVVTLESVDHDSTFPGDSDTTVTKPPCCRKVMAHAGVLSSQLEVSIVKVVTPPAVAAAEGQRVKEASPVENEDSGDSADSSHKSPAVDSDTPVKKPPRSRLRRRDVVRVESTSSSGDDSPEEIELDCSDESDSEACVPGPGSPRPKRLKVMTREECVLQGLADAGMEADLEVGDAGRRGRGVFAKTDIEKGTYLCEYRTTRVYHPNKKDKYVKEYELNGEGCYLLETCYKPKLVFDATRCFDQIGRYINHSSSGGNCCYWRPLYVRGKYRVGFVATRHIRAGEELYYDYGVRGLDWMSKSPVKVRRATHKRKRRIPRHCPVPDCHVSKPLLKLSQHLKQSHCSLSASERQKYLLEARERASEATSGPLQIPAQSQRSLTGYLSGTPFRQASHTSGKGKHVPGRRHVVKGARPASEKRGENSGWSEVAGEGSGRESMIGRGQEVQMEGSEVELRSEGGDDQMMSGREEESVGSVQDRPNPRTGQGGEGKSSSAPHGREEESSGAPPKPKTTRSYNSFPIKQSQYLSSLFSYARNRFGLAQSTTTATEFVMDVSKYLFYAGKGCEDVHNLYNCCSVQKYLEKLEKDGIGTSGQLTKLQRIEAALKHASLEQKWSKNPDVDIALSRFGTWKQRLQKEKTAHTKKKASVLSETVQSASESFREILTRPEVRERVEKALSCTNPTPSEFDAITAFIAIHLFLKCRQRTSAVEGMTVAEYERAVEREGYWVVTVHSHKTSVSKGPAHLVFEPDLKNLCDRYLTLRRGRGSRPNFLVNHTGSLPSKLPTFAQAFAKTYDILLPNPTMLRKMAGTAACSLPQGDQEKVASFLNHSLDTQKRYYRHIESQHDSVHAYELVNAVESAPKKRPAKRRMFTEEQIDTIETYFADNISAGQTILLKDAAIFLESQPMKGRTAKNIQDKVRTLIRQEYTN